MRTIDIRHARHSKEIGRRIAFRLRMCDAEVLETKDKAKATHLVVQCRDTDLDHLVLALTETPGVTSVRTRKVQA